MFIFALSDGDRSRGVSSGDGDPDSWRRDGACRDEDPELFFPDGSGPEALAQVEQARAVCRRCPVQQACCDWSLTRVGGRLRDQYGVFAGMTPDERDALLRRLAGVAA